MRLVGLSSLALVVVTSSMAFAQTEPPLAPMEPLPPPEPSTEPPLTPPSPNAPTSPPSPPPAEPSTPPAAADTPGSPAAEEPSATAPASPAESEVRAEAGYFPGKGFLLRSSDDAFKMRIGLQSALRGQVRINGKAQVVSPFMTLRPILEGNLYKKWIRYWTSLELASNPVYLLDSYVEIQPVDAIGVRLGQQWTPFSRHEAINGPHQLLLPEWDAVSDYFWTGRDKGATLFGSFADQKIDYSVGAYLGNPLRQFTTIRGNYMFVARLGLSPNGPVGSEFAYADDDKAPAPFRWAIGVNGATSKVTPATENFNPSTFKFDVVPTNVTNINHTLGADVFVQSARVVALAEGYVRRTDPNSTGADYTSIGGFAQAGVLVYERKVDVSARFSWADVNVDAAHDNAFGIEAASSWYFHAPNVVFKLRYGYGSQMTPPDGSTTSSGAAPLILSTGHLHVMTAQINTAF